MKLSAKTKETLAGLDEFSGNKIKNPYELSVLIELSAASHKEILFESIQFTAKYLNGLTKILQSNISLQPKTQNGGSEPKPNPTEAREKIMEEYKKNIVKFSNYLKDLLLEAGDPEKDEIEEKYLALNRTAMVNLTSLIYDLSWLKKYHNTKR